MKSFQNLRLLFLAALAVVAFSWTPAWRPDGWRMDALMARADPTLAAEVKANQDAYRRAKSLAASLPDAPANAALVAALQLSDNEFAAAHHWIRGPWLEAARGPIYYIACFVSGPRELPPPGPANLPLNELRKIFDLSYEGGRLPIQAVTRTYSMLYCVAPGEADRLWNLQRLETLRAALSLDFEHPNVWLDDDPKARPGWDPSATCDHALMVWEQGENCRVEMRARSEYGMAETRLTIPDIAKALGIADWTSPTDEEIDLVIRCIRQAGWVTE